MNKKKKIVDIGSKFVEYLGKLYNFEMIWVLFVSFRNILNNFIELDDIMEKNELVDKFYCIFKVDEKGIF